MEITDLTEKYHQTYFHCLEDWSDEIKEAGDHKERWFQQMKNRGLRVKLALEDGNAVGMIQYIPAEYASIRGEDLYFIQCIWVHGHKQGIGNHQGHGIGRALLAAAEADVCAMSRKGIATWGIALPFWMKAGWYKKQGYRKVDKDGISVLLWKPFTEDAQPPKWIKIQKRPSAATGKVTVTSFINGSCTSQNMVHERAKRAAREFGTAVEFKTIKTCDREVFLEWGIADALYINTKRVRTGPPPSYKKIRKKIAKQVKKLPG